MAQTPRSAADPYCTAAVLLRYHDWAQVADFAGSGEDADRPAQADLTNAASDAGAVVLAALMAASGELESACQVGGRYTPADLQALTRASKARLEKVTADLAFWGLAQRRTPLSGDPSRCPGARQALEELDKLRDGQRIFGLVESAEAGLPGVIEPSPLDAARVNGVVRKASRLFGRRGRDEGNY